MATQPIPPLRVQKGSNASSPKKDVTFAQNRPLSELSPMALRRNSPSFPRHSLSKNDSSPATSSPFNNAASPRMFWQGREPNSPSCENVSPSKRSSIENLKKASRVKNSSMFAREQQSSYDPSNPSILDGRPLRTSLQGNAFGGKGLISASTTITSTTSSPTKFETVRESSVVRDPISPPEQLPSPPFSQVAPLSPSKLNASPTKSSLSKKTGANFRNPGFDPSTGIWEDEDDEEKTLPEGRSLHRHAKSVTFDQAPPQVNEYVMTTPDPSSVASGSREGSYESFDDEEGEYSFDRGSSFDPHDDSFDASLEDTEKTPVVLPEDWRFMSPETANTELARHEEDVFDDDVGSPAPEARPGLMAPRQHQTSVNSVDSNGQTRPLPPLPPADLNSERQSSQRDSLSSTLERMSGTHRALPPPPPAADLTKEDIRRMSNTSLSLEDRLKMMMIKDTTPQKSDAEVQRERRMRRAGSKDVSPIRDHVNADESVAEDETETETETKVPKNDLSSQNRRLSRDFILQQLRPNLEDISRSNSQYSTASLDPDVPIPSREDPTQTFDDEYEDESIFIKEEPVDDSELYAIPDMYRKTSSQLDAEDEDRSQYSQSSIQRSVELNADTPRAQSPVHEPKKSVSSERMSLPDFMDFGEERSFDFGLGQYITRKSEEPSKRPEPVIAKFEEPALPDLAGLRNEISRPFTPEQQLEPPRPTFAQEEVEEPGTPSSVIRHPVEKSPSPEMEGSSDLAKTDSNTGSIPSVEVSEIEDEKEPTPEQRTEASAFDTNPQSPIGILEPEKKRTGARVSSLVQLDFPREASNDSLGLGLEKEFDRVLEAQKVAFESSLRNLYHPFNGRFPSAEFPDTKEFINRQKLSYFPIPSKPVGLRDPDSSFLGQYANKGANRQRGYLMRQNTKIVVATERASVEEPRSPAQAEPSNSLAVPNVAPNEVVTSPRKTSQPTWTAEPWNSKTRRRSIRINGETSPIRKAGEGLVPPLPGQLSSVMDGLAAVAEDEFAEEEEFEEGAERGRLFVKVVGVKDLQLPFPQQERTHFALTLDNGLHCVTTSWLDLAKSAPIGQEFELVVLNDLEFQLTLQMKLEEPTKPVLRPESPTKAPASPKKQNAFGRLFGSPKKRKQESIDFRAQQEALHPKRPITPPSAYELVQGIVAKDGSFARAYVSVSEYEKQAYGRPTTVDIKCFNEWATEEVSVGSSRSKKGVVQLQRRPPYEIGKLELQLLFVPKPKGSKDEDMPKSMNGAIRAMREAEERLKQRAEAKEFEGFLSQQGGDCPYWRRRFFKLIGPKLTAYHETTRQPRATINLAKAAKLIDDKANLARKEVSTRGGGRRKSAFADDEEGYMFVEEGFRIRFANGEVIDFYADSAAAKDEWMAALSQAVGKQIAQPANSTNGWTEMVLKREKSVKAKSSPPSPSKRSDIPTRKPSKELPARPQIGQRQSFQGPLMASGTLQQQMNISGGLPMSPPSSPQKSALPRPSGHMRMDSFQSDMSVPRSQAGSPVKSSSRTGREERHRKTKSMWG